MTIMINKGLLQSTTCIYYSTISLTLSTQAHQKQGGNRILKRKSSSSFRRNQALKHMPVASAGHCFTDAEWMSSLTLQEVQSVLGMRSVVYWSNGCTTWDDLLRSALRICLASRLGISQKAQLLSRSMLQRAPERDGIIQMSKDETSGLSGSER
jgi:hypothetical protein